MESQTSFRGETVGGVVKCRLLSHYSEGESPIGHFRVPPGLYFKTRVGAQPLIWKLFFIMQIKLLFTSKVVHLASFFKVRVFGNRKWPIKPQSVYNSLRALKP